MSSAEPKLSIITINLNNKEGLRLTIESVIKQTFKQFEYIVIDGASTDGSATIIEQYQDQIDHVVIEKDNGIYNAMNKGIKIAKGDYLLFLHSGDWLFENDALQNAFALINPDASVCSADIYVNDGKTVTGFLNPEAINCSFFIYGNLYHQASFIKRKMFEKYGGYNEANKVVSDWEFFILILVLKGEPYQHLPIWLSVYNLFGISNNPKMEIVHKKERKEVLNALIPPVVQNEIAALQTEIFQYKILDRKLKERRYVLLEQIEESKPLRYLLTVLMLVLSKFTTLFKK
jgi:glycosyltransferase involved in cell wall biosynthesis